MGDNIREKMQSVMSKDEATTLFDSEWWAAMELTDAARLQLDQRLLCMPWELFHKGIGELLGRPVCTHEFADADRLKTELATLTA